MIIACSELSWYMITVCCLYMKNDCSKKSVCKMSEGTLSQVLFQLWSTQNKKELENLFSVFLFNHMPKEY